MRVKIVNIRLCELCEYFGSRIISLKSYDIYFQFQIIMTIFDTRKKKKNYKVTSSHEREGVLQISPLHFLIFLFLG